MQQVINTIKPREQEQLDLASEHTKGPEYKQTQIGIIPSDWEVGELSRVATIQSGIAKNSKKSVQDPVEVHYLRVANVQDGFLDLSEVSRIAISRHDLKRYSVLPGDVLMNEGGDMDKLGRGAVWSGEFDPCVHQNHVFVVRCSNQIDPHYLNFWSAGAIARCFFLLTGKQTTNLASISKSGLSLLPVAIPPKREQRAVTNALLETDALIESLEKLITKKQAIKTATMQQLLTGKTRLPQFAKHPDGTPKGTKPSELGENPEDWEVLPLSMLASIRSGGTPSTSVSEFWNGEVNWCTPTDITSLNGRKYLTTTARTITGLGLKSSAAELLPGGSIVMTSRATIGECAIAQSPMSTNQGFKNFIPNTETDLEFLYYLLSSQKLGFIGLCSGSTFLEISTKQVRNYEVSVPKFPEQAAIAKVLSDQDEEIHRLQRRLAKTRQIKQGMMQQLLTGKIRLLQPEALPV